MAAKPIISPKEMPLPPIITLMTSPLK